MHIPAALSLQESSSRLCEQDHRISLGYILFYFQSSGKHEIINIKSFTFAVSRALQNTAQLFLSAIFIFSEPNLIIYRGQVFY